MLARRREVKMHKPTQYPNGQGTKSKRGITDEEFKRLCKQLFELEVVDISKRNEVK